jgi:hypothetical protein
MKASQRRFQCEPTKVKLWELKYYPPLKNHESEGKKKRLKENDPLVIDFGSNLTRVVKSAENRALHRQQTRPLSSTRWYSNRKKAKTMLYTAEI